MLLFVRALPDNLSNRRSRSFIGEQKKEQSGESHALPDQRKLLFGVCFLLEAVGDSAPGQVVGTQLHGDFISRQNPNKVATNLTGNVSEHLVPVLQRHFKFCVRERLDDGSFYFNAFFFFRQTTVLPQDPNAGGLSTRLGLGSPAPQPTMFAEV